MDSNEKLKQIILEQVTSVLKEYDANNLIAQDFKNNAQKIKRLGQQYENIMDPSFNPIRIKELKVDLFNMFVNSLDTQTKIKYNNMSELNAIKIAEALIGFYRKTKTGRF